MTIITVSVSFPKKSYNFRKLNLQKKKNRIKKKNVNRTGLESPIKTKYKKYTWKLLTCSKANITYF